MTAVEMFALNPAATAFGTAGLLCQLAWPLFRRPKTILALQLGIGASYAMHYAFIGAWTGTGVAGLGAAQSAMTLLAGDRPWLRRVGLACLPAAAAVSVATWSGLPSMLALSAVTLIMLGRMQRDVLRLRILLLAAAPFGMSYDVVVGAGLALIGGIVSASVAAAMLAREIRDRRRSRSSDLSRIQRQALPLG